jgi:glycosyltransferase involved in cell wall biosynthesis
LEAAAQVYKEVPSAFFVLVGSGPQENELKTRVKDLGIQERILFLKEYPDIPTAIAALDIAVQPSLSESLSNVLLEYMASAKPIVATDVGDADKLIRDGLEGYLVQPDHPAELTKAILTLYGNWEKAIEMGKRCRGKARLNWSSQKILTAYSDFYQNLFKRRFEPN